MPRGWPFSRKIRGETNAITDGTSDLSVRDTFENIFGLPGHGVSYFVSLKLTADKAMSFKFNSTDEAPVSVAVAEYPFEVQDAKITDIYVTNSSGASAALRIEGAGV